LESSMFPARFNFRTQNQHSVCKTYATALH